jgi:hypothetical protein
MQPIEVLGQIINLKKKRELMRIIQPLILELNNIKRFLN